jgi:hypothetical protein
MHAEIQMVFNKASIMSPSGRIEQENTSGYFVRYRNLNLVVSFFLFVQIAIRKLIHYIFPTGYCADGTLFI